METTDAKRELRIAKKSRRREVPPEVRVSYSAEVCGRILDREDVKRAIAGKGVFAVYLASTGEIDLAVLVGRLWDCGCRVVVPAWRGDTYRLVEYSRETKLVAGPMGIPEPEETAGGRRHVDESEVSVWMVPGLAFSPSGARLGYGGGWYDRFLSRADPLSVSLGVAYPFQVVGTLPLEPHDLSLTDVIFGRHVDSN
jgi:5-formyltetrahydrofolate cyclo-ligase